MPSSTTISGAPARRSRDPRRSHVPRPRPPRRRPGAPPPRAARSSSAAHPPHRHALLLGEAQDRRQPIVGARRHAQERDALRAQGLEDRIDAVDQHGDRRRDHENAKRAQDFFFVRLRVFVTSWSRRRRSSARANADARSRLPRMAGSRPTRGAPRRGRSTAPPGRAPGPPRGRSARRESDGTAPYPFDPSAPSHGSPPREISRDRAAAPPPAPRRARAPPPARPPPHLAPQRLLVQRALGRVVEQQREPRRHLVEAIDRRARHRHGRCEKLDAGALRRTSTRPPAEYGSDSSASRSGSATFR